MYQDCLTSNLTWPDVQRKLFAKTGYAGMEWNSVNPSDASDTYLEGNFLISSKFSNKFLTKAK